MGHLYHSHLKLPAMTHWDGIVIIVFLWSYGFPYENLRFQIYQIVNLINLIWKNLRDSLGFSDFRFCRWTWLDEVRLLLEKPELYLGEFLVTLRSLSAGVIPEPHGVRENHRSTCGGCFKPHYRRLVTIPTSFLGPFGDISMKMD